MGQHPFHLGAVTTGGAATGRDSVYIFLGGWDKTFFIWELGQWVGLTQGEVEMSAVMFWGWVMMVMIRILSIWIWTRDDATGRDNPTVSGGMGGGALNLSLGRDNTLVSGAMGVDPLNLSLGSGRDNPTVSGHGGMGVASLNLSMGRDDGTVPRGMGVVPLNLSMGREDATV